MRVSVIKQNQIQNIILPDKIVGNYWISDFDNSGIKRNLISIEADGDKWKLMSNKEVYYLKGNTKEAYVYLSIGGFYTVYNATDKTSLLLYCSSVLMNTNDYDITGSLTSGITIGSSANSFIHYSILDELSATIKQVGNKIYIIDNHSKYGVYVNNVRVLNQKELKIGDVIFMIGLKMIFMVHKNGNQNVIYLSINNGNIPSISVKLNSITVPSLGNTPFTEDSEEVEYPLYDEKDYFNKTPRFLYQVKPLELQVDAPPTKEESKDGSLILTLGPMVTMSMTSMVTGYTAVNNVLNGGSTWSQAMPSLVISMAMFASVFIWPLFSKWYTKKTLVEKERLRQQKYSEYIEKKREEIIAAKNEQTQILTNNYPPIKDVVELVLKHYATLWQRRREDADFLEVNLGLGNYPMQIDIQYPQEHFSMAEDNLKDMLSKLGNEPKMLANVPVVFSFFEHKISGIVGEENVTGEYMRRILLQLLAFHSYDNLKIIVLTDEKSEYQWSFLKSVPHCFTNDKSLRFFGTTSDEYKEICYYLDKVYMARKENFKQDMKKEDIDCVYFILTDNLKKVRNFDVIKHLLEDKQKLGICLFTVDKKITSLPDQCTSFIELFKDHGEVYTSLNNNEKLSFSLDLQTDIDYEKCALSLANIPIEISNNDEGQLPNTLGFLEMYDVGKIEQLNASLRWQNSNPMLNLQAPVGFGKNGEKISLDLHEKYHGPHGLIAGMTGSGKSEFIISYILSMAINYHPYEVQFILIDYKGGGLAGAFENKTANLKLPHLVGTITNLDANEIKRSLASIDSELKRREALFNVAREVSGESTIDIYKYQKMYRDGIVKEPVSHLFIISDEFAELKNQEPEFMDQLISTARIGRSLGVHLILATQKPSGVVDPQIWSNTRFRVCLRVQDKSDSNEVIKCPDAAYLKQTGRFYFQVGYNEVFALGQAAWAGKKYLPMEKVNKTIDTNLDFVNNIGYPVKTVATKEHVEPITTSKGEELLNIVKYLDQLAKDQNINCKPLWLEAIASDIKVDDLAKKYDYQREPFLLNPIVGEYDVPTKQEQRLLTLPISASGNVALYGSSGSGKENFITTFLYSSMCYYTAEEVNYYILDFGAEALRMFASSPIVGDILTVEDDEKIKNLYKMLDRIMDERKTLFQDYNGDYMNYCKNSGKTVPNIVVVINNYESYQETYERYDDKLTILSREGNKYGIYFILTLNTPNGMRFKLKQNFKTIYSLQQNSEEDYTTILGNVHKTYPSHIFGRGILKGDSEDVYEFQTAMACEEENTSNFIRRISSEYEQKASIRALKIPILPMIVSYQQLLELQEPKKNEIMIGLDKNTLEVSTLNFVKNYATMITMDDLNEASDFINPLIKQLQRRDESSFVIINTEEVFVENGLEEYQYVDSDFNGIFEQLVHFVKEQYKFYEENHYSKKIFEGKKTICCMIIGVDTFKNRLKEENKTQFADLFTTAKDLGIIHFILVDSIDKIKKIELDPWYKNSVNSTTGIWLGNGINDQFSLKMNQKIDELKQEVPIHFCFVVKRGKPEYVKYVETMEIE